MITIKNLDKSYGNLRVLASLNFSIREGIVTAITGPSGCGKTTLLNIIAGIDKNFTGEVCGLPEKISYCFQEDRLIEWKSVEDNLRFVMPEKENFKEEILSILKVFRIEDISEKKARFLSGGQKQRAALARAFYYDAPLILLDEPLKSLDIDLKNEVMREIKEIISLKKSTVVMITHDLIEAEFMADEILDLSGKPALITKRDFKREDKEGVLHP